MSYQRVIPRDLFNESKLLKCLGQLSLLLHDEVDIRWPLRLLHEPSDGFFIDQRPSDGALYCSNLILFLEYEDRDTEIIDLVSLYNNKDPYPLMFDDGGGNEERVFDDEGQLSYEFVKWLDRKNA